MIRPETWARAIDKWGRLGRGPYSKEGCALDVWYTLPGTDSDKYTLLFQYYERFGRTPSADNDRFKGTVEERAVYMSGRIRQLSQEVAGD